MQQNESTTDVFWHWEIKPQLLVVDYTGLPFL